MSLDKFVTLVDLFEQSVAQHRDRPLFGVKKAEHYVWLSYGEVGAMVDKMRGALAKLGVGAGDSIGIIANNRPEWAIAAYAACGRGAAFVPMYEAQLASDWSYIANDAELKLLFVANQAIYEKTRQFIDEIPSLQAIVVMDPGGHREHDFSKLLELGAQNPVDAVHPSVEDLACILYTSGTTGLPKGVLLRHSNIVSNVNGVHDSFPIVKEDVTLSFLPWAHIFGQTAELHTMISFGAAMGLAESPQTIIQNLAEVRPTILISVPRIFNRIYDGIHRKVSAEKAFKRKMFEKALSVANRKRELEEARQSSTLVGLQHSILDKLVFAKIRQRFGGRLRWAISGGAALSKEVAEFIDSLGIMVYEGYGLTETSPVVACNVPGSRKLGSIGKTFPGVRVVIRPDDMAPEGQGELIVYGPNVMKGYHKLPEENARVFTEDGGFCTGDMGRIDDDGFLWITGRIKEQYKLENGKYVVPAPLEEKLKLSPYIANIMIEGTNRPFNVAVVVPDFEVLEGFAKEHGLEPAHQALLSSPKVMDLFIQEIQRLGVDFKGYEQPKKLLLIEEDFTFENDMLTPSLKLKRRNVLARYGSQLEALFEE
ncbi:MAG: long-chain fatty acid--CoA ligase [Myxococcota bacterium]|jgi:long-chain acyl-CoA synthetase|nr:long-chain fatty acid--CoA ligase [Myxococcota bacterium]